MTPAEHYVEAERLTRRAEEQDPDFAAFLNAQALTHATLAASVRPVIVCLPWDEAITPETLDALATAITGRLQG